MINNQHKEISQNQHKEISQNQHKEISQNKKLASFLKLKDISFINNPNPTYTSATLLYIFNKDFQVPKSSIYILLKYKDLFSNLLEYTKYFKLKEELFFMQYDSLLSGYLIELDINVIDYGVEIHLEGISTKILEISTLLMNFLFTSQGEGRESLVVSQINKNLMRDKFTQSYKRLFQKLKCLYIEDYLLPEEYTFTNKKLDINNFDYELCVIGNILQEDALTLENVIRKYKCNNNTIINNTTINNDNIYKVNTFDISNNACGLFFPFSKEDKAISLFIVSTVEEMFFDQLRTNEEFGYVVTANICSVRDREFIYFVVQSEREVLEIRNRIIKFIDFSKEYIRNMKEEEFLERKESLICNYREPFKNLNAYAHFHYNKRINNINGLFYKEEMIKKIENMTLEEVKEKSRRILEDKIVKEKTISVLENGLVGEDILVIEDGVVKEVKKQAFIIETL